MTRKPQNRRAAIQQSRRAGTVRWLNYLEGQKRKAAEQAKAKQQDEAKREGNEK